MYKLIGADGRPYGPASADQIRKWMAEKRVDAQTLLQPDGATDWKPLMLFPEFSPPPPLTPPPLAEIQPTLPSRASNKIPAGICGILLGGFGVHKFILGYTGTGLLMLALSLGSFLAGFATCGMLWPTIGVMHVIGLIEGIIYLTKSDEDFVRLYVQGRKEWF
jgi:hypothetical protein